MILRSAIVALLVIFEAGGHSRPVSFQQNKGQAPADVRYLFRNNGYQLDFKRGEIVFHREEETLRIRFDGPTKKRSPEGHARLDGLIRYIDALDEKNEVPAFASVRYDSLYAGIDLVFYGRGQRMESMLIVAPQADASQVVFCIDGAERMQVSEEGDLVFEVGGKQHRFRKPPAAQVAGSAKRAIDLRFRISHSNEISFEVGAYDHGLPLIIG